MSLKNSAAFHHFELLERFSAGMVLKGTEIKAVRKNQLSFQDSFCVLHKDEVWVRGLYIAPYELGTAANHEPTRERKLLLTRKEIRSIAKKIKERGLTLIPLSVFINKAGYAKIDLALARGKKAYDKRESIKERDLKRSLHRLVKT